MSSSASLRPLLGLVVATVIFLAAGPRASSPPETIKSIQATLPDSVSLDGKVVYVDFWASWCVPCRSSFPWMQDIHERFRDRGLVIVAVDVDKDSKAAQKFLKDNGADFPVIFDPKGELAEQYGLEVMPSSFIYDRSGRLVTQHQGFARDETDGLERTLAKLLNEGTSH